MTVVNTKAAVMDLLEEARLVERREKVSRKEAIKRVLHRRIEREAPVETHVTYSRRTGR